MECLIKGFIYELSNVEGSEPQLLLFRKEGEEGVGHDGTTPITVLEVLLDKLRFDHEQKKSRDTAIAVRYLEDALLRLKHGTDIQSS